MHAHKQSAQRLDNFVFLGSSELKKNTFKIPVQAKSDGYF